MKLEIADIATDEKKRLRGFKVLGVFPFYLRYIRTGTHIQLCRIKEQIHQICPEEPKITDFSDSKLQEKIIPLVNAYCVTALANNRAFTWFFKLLLRIKIRQCGHFHILNLYLTIFKLNDPGFFFGYWKLIKMKETTLLKEAKPSLESSLLTKKKQE